MALLVPFGCLVTWRTFLPLRVVEYLVVEHKGPLNGKVTSSVQDVIDEQTGSSHQAVELKESVSKGLRMDWVCLKADHNCHVDVGCLEVWRRAQKMGETDYLVH